MDKKPKALAEFKSCEDPKFTAGLPTEIKLAIGARVMLTRNVDSTDGLVNGSQGTVVGFINRKKVSMMTDAILVVNVLVNKLERTPSLL